MTGLFFKNIKLLRNQEIYAHIILYNWILWRNNQLLKAPREKHKNIIIIELTNIWPEIAESQKLG